MASMGDMRVLGARVGAFAGTGRRLGVLGAGRGEGLGCGAVGATV